MSTQSVVTAIRVIEAVSDEQPVGLSELARELDASKATVLRALTTLEGLRWVEQNDSSKLWSLTAHAYAVAVRSGAMSTLRDIAIAPMNALQLATTETVHLAIPDGDILILAERLDTPHVLRAFLPLGSKIPLHASATGLAYLAAAEDAYIHRYFESSLDSVTERTLTDRTVLLDEIRAVRARGYSINEEGLSTGITSLGAAILGPGGDPLGSVSVSGPSSRIVPERYAEYGAAVHEAARAIGRAAAPGAR
ncbi:IclR family transcriptional regulator [Leucobacter sp. G161]|uniref:IclR family transcriptional regulator n=1 Tax=Leucobacter sp. G161 TaxID=663704 RepID=UPI00073C1560|nr:IclR family transcriptional regulator [Leucobacter sp. G161]KUF07528.1 IclR family transcriptional regulator [Leucobacter sp. G161]